MRLIDADVFKIQLENAYEYTELGEVIDMLDNTPTVEPKTKLVASVTFNKEQVEELVEKAKADILAQIERPQGEWIPVSERLPEEMQRVLIWFEYYRYGDFNCMYQTYGFGYVCDDKWSPFINGETGWQDYRVIAWQPLPEPYKKGGAE